MRKIRARNADLKVIFISGVTERKARDEMLGAGAVAMFDKPIPMADFLDAVERSLGLVRTIFPPEMGLEIEEHRQNLSELLAGFRYANARFYSLSSIARRLARSPVQLGWTLPLNLAYPPDEIEYFLSDSAAKLFFTLESTREKIEPVLSRLPELQECIFLDPSKPEKFQSLITNYQLPVTLVPANPARSTAPAAGPPPGSATAPGRC